MRRLRATRRAASTNQIRSCARRSISSVPGSSRTAIASSSSPLVESLLTRDDYMLLADYQAYVDCQQRVSDAYSDQNNWTRMSILNSARVGRFSSDRSIREYCRDIWNVRPIVPDER